MSTYEDGGRRGRRKDLQVCRQVFEALSWALAELDEPALEDLALVSVEPAPDASRVLVTLAATRPGVDLERARAALAALAPELREEVASEVHRKRPPELAFRVEPAG